MWKIPFLVLISLFGFMLAPFAFPFTLVGIWCALVAPLFIAGMKNKEPQYSAASNRSVAAERARAATTPID